MEMRLHAISSLRFVALLSLILQIIHPAVVADSSWPSFRFDSAHSARSSYLGPSNPNLGWMRQVGIPGFASPVVANGRIYAAGGGSIMAFSESGELLWARDIGLVGKSGPAVSSDGTIFIASSAGTLFAFLSNGDPKWKADLSGPIDSSPAITENGTVYIGCSSGKLEAYSSNGIRKFTYSAGGAIASSPAVGADGTIYFGCDDGKLYAITSAGKAKWTFSAGGAIKCSPSIGSDGTVYFGTMNGFFYGVRSSGTQKFRFSCGIVVSSPAIEEDGSICFGSRDGYFYCISSYGALQWKQKIGISVDCTPSIDSAGTIFAAASDGTLYAFAPNGNIGWSTPIGAGIVTSPAICENKSLCILCTDGMLYYLGSDSTPPLVPVVTDAGEYSTSQDALSASWSSIDPESGISRYEYAIGTTSGATDILDFTDAGTATEVTYTGLPLRNGQVYYIAVRATNGAGLVSDIGVSDGVKVDFTPPSTPVVTDDGNYLTTVSMLNASWSSLDPESGVVRYKYAVGTSPGADDVVPFADAGDATHMSLTGLQLVNGKTYYISVRAVNAAGLVSTAGVSDGIKIDTTPPSRPVVIDDGEYSTNLTTLHASWTCSDAESGVAEYEYAIGTSPGSADAASFTSAGKATEISRSGLNLVSGKRYYVSVRAKNDAGLVSETGESDGITIDTSEPSVPVVTDTGAYSSSTNTLSASWTSSDPESGIAKYEYAIGTSPGAADIIAFTDVGINTQVTRIDLQLVSGKDYYFTVRATNGAGLGSALGISDGIRIDSTPPAKPVVIDDGAYTARADALHVSYSSGDTESGTEHYEVSVGTSSGKVDVMAWRNMGLERDVLLTGLNLQHGSTYYVNVRAYNHAGLTSTGSSDGILLDLTSPVVKLVTVSAAVGEMRVNVNAADEESGVILLRCAVISSPQVPDNVLWTEYSPSGEIKLQGQFESGKTYYVAAAAKNGAGTWSAHKVSAPVIIDDTPPDVPKVIDSGDYSSDNTRLSASWSSQDTETGIKKYSYCLGTQLGLDDVVGWTDTVANGVNLTALNLINGGKYYFSVRATNNVGLQSSIGTSDGIIIDITPPLLPVVTDDGEYSYASDSLHATIDSTDNESGIAGYAYCIGTAPGSDDIAPWTSGTGPSVNVYDLSLVQGTKYYISAKVCNGAGIWSEVGISDGIEYIVRQAIWPRFRYDLCNGGKCDIHASTLGNFFWRARTEGYVESSPAVAGDGTLYVGSSDGKLYAIGRNGDIRWTYATGGGIDSSPALDNRGRIYFGSYDTNLYCLSPAGELIWKFPAKGMIWSSPAIAEDGTVYIGCHDHQLYAVNSDGTLKWKFSAGGAIWSSPAVGDDGTIYFACGDSKLYAVTSEGKLKWDYLTGSAADSSPAIGPDGTVHFGSGDGYFYAIQPDGTLRWQYFTGDVTDSSCAIAADGTAYVGVGGPGTKGYFLAIDAYGRKLWQISLPQGVRSSPALSTDGILYFGCADGKVYAVRSEDGSIVWSRATGESILSSPAFGYGGSVLVGSEDGYIYCFRDYDAADSTPPTTPVVRLARSFIAEGTALECSWSASDPESGIEGYSFAIGTTAGADDVVTWTSVGASTLLNRSDQSLAAGRTYFISVRATNHVGLTSAAGTSSALAIVPSTSANTVGIARKQASGTQVYLPGKIVTAVFDDCIFIEEPDRSAGVRCLVQSTGLQVGAVVDILARVAVQYGEVVLDDIEFGRLAVAAGPLRPVAISGRSVSGPGLNPMGLLVRVCGRVSASGDYYFLLADGSGTLIVWTPPYKIPDLGSFAVATGVVCKEIVNGSASSVIRVIPGTEVDVISAK